MTIGGTDATRVASDQPQLISSGNAPPKELGSCEKDAHENITAPRDMSKWCWILLSSAITFANVLVNLDSTIVANLQPQILQALGSISKFPWINPTYSLGNVGSSLLWGKLYLMVNHRYLFLTAFVLFEAGSTLSGAAPNMDAHIVGRAITGIGASGLWLGTLNAFANLTTKQERPVYVSLLGLSFGIGTILGPVLGGLFAQSHAGWRWSFYLNLICGALTFPIYLFLLPSYRTDLMSMNIWSKIRSIDILGYLLWVGGLISLVMILSFGGAQYSWVSSSMIALIVCTIIFWLLFTFQQTTSTLMPKGQGSPIFPVRISKRADICIFAIQTAIGFGVLFVTINYLPLYFQFARGEHALQSAKDMLPLVFFGVTAFMINGAFIGRTYYMLWWLGGSVLSLIGAALMYITQIDSPHALVYVASALLSGGSSAFCIASFPVVQAKVPSSDVADATTLIGCLQVGSQALSLALANCIFFNSAASGIEHVLPGLPTSTLQRGIAGARASILGSVDTDTQARILQAVLVALRDVWTQIICISALAVVLSVFMGWGKVPKT